MSDKPRGGGLDVLPSSRSHIIFPVYLRDVRGSGALSLPLDIFSNRSDVRNCGDYASRLRISDRELFSVNKKSLA